MVNKMASHDIAHIDSRRFMTRPPHAYRQLSQTEKGMVEQWCNRSGKAFVHKRGFLLYFDMPMQYIALIFVERAHRGRGIGSALLSKCATPCMATILDDRIWQKHGWELHTVVPGHVTVAVQGLTTPEHRLLFDGEIVSMWLHSKLPVRVQVRMTKDPEFAGAMNQRLLRSTRVMMDMRKSLVATGMPTECAMRTLFDSCAEELDRGGEFRTECPIR